MSDLTWYSEEYKSDLNDGASNGQLGHGQWWWVGLTTGGGLAIGLVKVLWSLVVAPYPLHPPTLLTEVRDLHTHHPTETLATLLISAISLGCGASVGPEAAMGAVGGALGTVLGRARHPLYRKAQLHDGADPDDGALVPGRLIPLYSLSGMAAAFGPLLPSPFLCSLLLHELSVVSGPAETANSAYSQFRLMEVAMHTGIGASTSYALFFAIKQFTFLTTQTIPPFAILVDANGDQSSWTQNIVYAIPVGVVCGVVALFGVAFLAAGKQLGKRLHAALARLGGRNLGLLLTPAVGGALFGLLAKAFPLVLGDGNYQLSPVVISSFLQFDADGNLLDKHGSHLSAGTLIATAFAKLASMGIALGFGFVGGQIFPLIFAGACVGSAVHLLIPGLPVAMTVPCCCAAVPAAITPAPMSMVALISVVLSLGGEGTAPVGVACIMSYTTLCGMGVLQAAMERRLRS